LTAHPPPPLRYHRSSSPPEKPPKQEEAPVTTAIAPFAKTITCLYVKRPRKKIYLQLVFVSVPSLRLLANDIGKLTWVTERDSAKDEAVVFIFIFATVGLLIYAAVRPWVEKWTVAMRERRSYIPISTAAGADES
jgi:hypothetical protein